MRKKNKFTPLAFKLLNKYNLDPDNIAFGSLNRVYKKDISKIINKNTTRENDLNQSIFEDKLQLLLELNNLNEIEIQLNKKHNDTHTQETVCLYLLLKTIDNTLKNKYSVKFRGLDANFSKLIKEDSFKNDTNSKNKVVEIDIDDFKNLNKKLEMHNVSKVYIFYNLNYQMSHLDIKLIYKDYNIKDDIKKLVCNIELAFKEPLTLLF